MLRATAGCNFPIPTVKRGPKLVFFVHLDLEICFAPQRPAIFHDPNFQKSGPKLACFVHFALEMRFAPQWRATFPDPNFQKWSEAGVFCTFWLENALRATAAPTLRSSRPTNHLKKAMFRDFPNISRACNFFLLNFFLSSTLLFYSSLLFISPYCRKFDF